MTKNQKGILTIAAVIAIVAAGYHFFHRSAKQYAKTIIAYGGSNGTVAELINMMQEEFLKAWAKALVKGKPDFSYNGESYNAKGGTKIIAK